ncbi:cupin domain [Pacificibacter maritimus]|uniref:Cupin domain n=1 Tax=Pacificibacter maritimus TaxID=762213 RepID=A0A3N4UVZ2_9RHOB|nr:cupin domain-containing protein [Pacificibacter maritimus]RPE71669.1 cupin domain [Pacificibacter maritimus]
MSHVRSFPEVQVDAYVRRQVLSENDTLMVVAFTFEEQGEGALHAHPHVQSTYVESGVFTFSIDGETFDVSAGDSFVIPANAVHGCKCQKAGRLVDTFTPRRDDFL